MKNQELKAGDKVRVLAVTAFGEELRFGDGILYPVGILTDLPGIYKGSGYDFGFRDDNPSLSFITPAVTVDQVELI